MDLKQAIRTTESYIKTQERLINKNDRGEYNAFLKRNNEAIKTLLNVVKSNTYLINN